MSFERRFQHFSAEWRRLAAYRVPRIDLSFRDASYANMLSQRANLAAGGKNERGLSGRHSNATTLGDVECGTLSERFYIGR
jgi:hypothetical protein